MYLYNSTRLFASIFQRGNAVFLCIGTRREVDRAGVKPYPKMERFPDKARATESDLGLRSPEFVRYGNPSAAERAYFSRSSISILANRDRLRTSERLVTANHVARPARAAPRCGERACRRQSDPDGLRNGTRARGERKTETSEKI